MANLQNSVDVDVRRRAWDVRKQICMRNPRGKPTF
ncbi:hypothetical protein V6Z11_A11G364700 [Gossypium hirsutum]|uniref:Uncharacterized protein n=2 Tax=Gossypium TaxID=3633 RepID=A0A5D2NID4_GOSTO|nr:hypothetical protein ES288_A11G368600v1 [Gossypium darwinii]TYI03841.1 hypothetical protein ES332_A11G370200v1 [Gossypium tomentosum]